jgi:hypothetical protein
LSYLAEIPDIKAKKMATSHTLAGTFYKTSIGNLPEKHWKTVRVSEGQIST